MAQGIKESIYVQPTTDTTSAKNASCRGLKRGSHSHVCRGDHRRPKLVAGGCLEVAGKICKN